MSDNQKILVAYYDDTSRETTVGELRQFFGHKSESKEWVKWFFKELELRGECAAKFANYKVVN